MCTIYRGTDCDVSLLIPAPRGPDQKIPLMNHSALALFAQRTRIPTSARRIGSVSFGFVLLQIHSLSFVNLRTELPASLLPILKAKSSELTIGPTKKRPTYFLQNIGQIRCYVSAFVLTSSQTRHQIYAYIRRLP